MNSGPFVIDGRGILMLHQCPNFNRQKEKVDKSPIWIFVLNIPFEYLDQAPMKIIGDKVGIYLKHEERVAKNDIIVGVNNASKLLGSLSHS